MIRFFTNDIVSVNVPLNEMLNVNTIILYRIQHAHLPADSV